jgi:hypothetical protein
MDNLQVRGRLDVLRILSFGAVCEERKVGHLVTFEHVHCCGFGRGGGHGRRPPFEGQHGRNR